MDYPNNPDYSPPQELLSYPDQYGNAYMPDLYSVSPNYSLESFFEPPFTGSEAPYDLPAKTLHDAFGPPLPPTTTTTMTMTTTDVSAASSNAASLRVASQQPSDTSPFGKLEHFSFGFSYDPRPLEPFGTACLSPTTHIPSRTPSLCGSAPEKASHPLSPRHPKRESPSSPDSFSEEPAPKRPQRKRGRPRLDRNADTMSSTSSPSSKSQRTARLPHNQVERKYREGLNSELERLRQAVPTLPQSDEAGAMGQPKPSKATVLASAIEYIKTIERERDALQAENERLRQAQAGSVVVRSWKVEDESLQDFLTEP
jgi:hypothetical protein